MCGIVGYIGPKKVVPLILDGLRRLEYRGYDSAGIAVVEIDGKMDIRRAPGNCAILKKLFACLRLTARMVLAIRAGPRTGVRRKKMHIHIGIAPEISWSCITELLKIIWS